jgi:hypothetical protein
VMELIHYLWRIDIEGLFHFWKLLGASRLNCELLDCELLYCELRGGARKKTDLTETHGLNGTACFSFYQLPCKLTPAKPKDLPGVWTP